MNFESFIREARKSLKLLSECTFNQIDASLLWIFTLKSTSYQRLNIPNINNVPADLSD